VRQFSVDDMQVGPADAARRDADSYFAGVRFPVGKVAQGERPPGTIEYHRAHQRSSFIVTVACRSPYLFKFDDSLHSDNALEE
jgi:hypothetical protein